MTDHTVWAQLTPDSRNEELDDGLRAAVRDPLWLLSRQWQVGEFQAADAGSPIQVDTSVAQDHMTTVDHRGAPDAPETPTVSYDGGPLEATVEREHVLTATEGPDVRRRATAGRTFCRALADAGFDDAGDPYTPGDFPERLRLSAPDEPMDTGDRRTTNLLTDRTVDGYAVFDSCRQAIPNLGAVLDEDASWSVGDASLLPLPSGARRTSAFEDGVETFCDWYRDLYDEPTERSGDAWDPTRMEYRFAVSTGDAEDESVLEAAAYAGGTLDWYAFDTRDESLSPPTQGASESVAISAMPTAVRFPGMPNARFWEIEEAGVSLTAMTGGGNTLSRLLLAEFALNFGNDWFLVPIETPVGTLSRVESLTVTDVFGTTTDAEPVGAEDDDWSFTEFDLPGHDEPGLFVPPTLGPTLDSESVESVALARDESANLVFGVEERVEGPTGRPVDRREFRPPRLTIAAVSPETDPDAETLTLQNTGDDDLSLTGISLAAETVTGQNRSTTQVHSFGDIVLPPDGQVTVYTGSLASDAESTADEQLVAIGDDRSAWSDADALVVHATDGSVLLKALFSAPSAALADYRLATDVPDHWFPFKTSGDTVDTRLARALLLDASTLETPIANLPRPQGRLLDPSPTLLPADEANLRLHDEEVPRSGIEVSRNYQLSGWHDGHSRLWSARKAAIGIDVPASGLRFDTVEERD